MHQSPMNQENHALSSDQQPVKLAFLRILLVRHGLSEDNLNSIWAGHRDSPLAPAGLVQAKALGSALASFHLNAIYSSDLKRAGGTAEEILKANRTVPPPPLVQTQSLREQNFGQAEGKSWSDAEYAITNAQGDGDAQRRFKFPEGESLEDVNVRMGISLRRYVLPRLEGLRSGLEGEEAHIVIVAHGIAIAELLRVLMSLHDTSSSSPWADPKEAYTRTRLENTGWTLVELGVPIEKSEDPPEYRSNRKPVYTRIVQQNNTDHLRTLPTSVTNASLNLLSVNKSTAMGSNENNAAALLAGGLSVNTDNVKSSVISSQGPKASNIYDTKYLMQELERAGNTSTMLSGSSAGDKLLATPLPSSSTSSTIPLPSQGNNSAASPTGPSVSPKPTLANAPGAWSDVWQGICVRVLPLFNGEDLKGNAEEINEGVSIHIKRTLDRSPARALDALSKDLYALCATGIYTLNSRLNTHFNDDFRLVEALSEAWTDFFTKILSWLESCFLPLQTDSTLSSLSRGHDNKPATSLQTEPVDIRKIALLAFRDQLIIPWFDRLLPLFLRIGEFDIDIVRHVRRIDTAKDQTDEEKLLCPRLMQMTKLLSSTHTSDEAQRTIEELLRALKTGHDTYLTLLNPSRNAVSHHRNSASTAHPTFTPLMREKKTSTRRGCMSTNTTSNEIDEKTVAGKENTFLYSLRSSSNTRGAVAREEDSKVQVRLVSDATTPAIYPLQASEI